MPLNACSEGPYSSTLLADVYDDMATVNSRLATLQSKWASIIRYSVQLEVGDRYSHYI